MRNKTVAILESRLGVQMAELIEKRGGKALRAPALAEVPDLDPQFISGLLRDLQNAAAGLFIFQTGVGTRALFEATDKLQMTPLLLSLLERAKVLARGPKPTAPLKSRGVRIDFNIKEPYTTSEIFSELAAFPLEGLRAVVQRYGAKNPELEHGLQARGAIVTEIPLYRWSLPADTTPLLELMDALERREVDAVVFTSASQVFNLFSLARTVSKVDNLAENVNATLVASIGPVCSAALSYFGVNAKVQASPPKLGPLISALDQALST